MDVEFIRSTANFCGQVYQTITFEYKIQCNEVCTWCEEVFGPSYTSEDGIKPGRWLGPTLFNADTKHCFS